MNIQTERIKLEPLGTKHFNTTCRYSTDPENTKMMCFLPCDSDDEVMNYLRKCEIQWTMETPEYLDAAILSEGVHVGAVSIELLDNCTVGEFGWIIDKNYWGRGFAVEAAEAFMKYVNNCFGLKRFIAHADADNSSSIRVMEKLGMRKKSISSGRKNRSSEEERMECLYELDLTAKC